MKLMDEYRAAKRTRHTDRRYFFVVDVHKRQHIAFEYDPTDEMIGDFFTNPVGGAKFHRFCNIIKNVNRDEYRPVDVDKLMAIHNEKIEKKV